MFFQEITWKDTFRCILVDKRRTEPKHKAFRMEVEMELVAAVKV